MGRGGQARERAEEKRALEAHLQRLQEEQDAWDAVVAAIRAKGSKEGQAASEQEEQDEAVAEELEAKLEELHKAYEVGKSIKTGRYKQVAAKVLKGVIGESNTKVAVAAAALRAVNAAVEKRTTQHVEMSFKEARVFLQECTAAAPEGRPAAPSVPRTARAAEVVSGGGWTSMAAGEVFGGEGQMDAERVDFDEFCFPEPTEKLTDEKLDEQIKGLLSRSKLETTKARDRYVQIMRNHKDAFCMGLKDFKPGQVCSPLHPLKV